LPSRGVATAAGLLLGVCVIGATVSDYGIGWDEWAQATYGELTYEYFASNGEDGRANEFLDLHLYGPLFETGAALLYSFDVEAKYLVRHWMVALTGLATVFAVVRIAGLFGLPWLGLLAALALATMPRFYGHAFLNSKDVPFACAVAWSLFALLRMLEARSSWPRALLFGLAAGIAFALRPGGAPLLLLLFGATLVYAGAGRDVRGLLRLAAALAMAWAVMIAGWPWAHESPFVNPLRAMGAALAFPTAYEVLFDGAVMASDQLPRSYFTRFLWLTTPPLVLLFAAAGLALCARDAIRARGPERATPQALASFVVPLWFVAPLLSAALLRPNVYDGLRHMLFVLPALALLAGRGAAELPLRMPQPALRRAAAAVVLVCSLVPVWSLVKLHPYQMTYFNAYAGGLPGAAGRYETDYWVTSYREAAEWLNARAAQRPEARLRVIAAIDAYSRECIAYALVDSVELVGVSQVPETAEIPEAFDYYVGTTRYALDGRFPASPVVHEIGRGGAVFSVIRARAHQAR
jgi:4-amino-4-deoxy-L-arabinose transferase-like glycosyltransferase